MIFGKSDEQRQEWADQWHKWFAWRPVVLLDGRYAWLEYVEFKEKRIPSHITSYYHYYIYRSI